MTGRCPATAPRPAAAVTLPGTGTLGTRGASGVSVSCPSAGNCAAGGDYTRSADHGQLFLITEHQGRWSTARAIPAF